MRLNQLTIKQAGRMLAQGEISSLDLTKACLKRIKEVDNKVKACLTVCEREALAMAKQADQRRAQRETGELLGIPCLIKDNILTRGIRTTASSRMLENYTAPFDATVIKKLKQAGAVILGKTNLDEFAHGASTENSAFGPTYNPWDLTRVPGGSSGGSAAAVAAEMCLFALGTDTGGSIRHPASYCGLVGLKPTYGRSSRYGLIAMTSSTDVPGPICKTVEDAALVLRIMAGPDPQDSTTVDEPVPDYGRAIKKKLAGLKIGLPKEFFIEGMNPAVEQAVSQAIDQLKQAGAELIDISLPHTKYAIAAYYIITPSEISSNLSRFDGIKYGYSVASPASLTSPRPSPLEEVGEIEAKNLLEVYLKSRGRGFGPEAKRRIMLGTFALSAGYFDAYYLRAQKVRTVVRQELDQALDRLDAIATPATPDVAFVIGEKADPLAMYLEDVFMASASLAGLPAISLPCGLVNRLPVGLQLIGRRFDEAMLLRIGHNYQQLTDWHLRRPELV